ncbi:hypothetical protein P154DRAFT_615531 [Amniculicola lignicola CBS 123094]|uniref:Uncharacterized protein n=1 Tax=Amniculicola lignicola CBS 123094 TaxID=1392246 RepID=A0A6A5X0R2_9PLEO|nr:hypothetical protein P154DRAFT_615531 [Amniculicola lignicola CBS 123094]
MPHLDDLFTQIRDNKPERSAYSSSSEASSVKSTVSHQEFDTGAQLLSGSVGDLLGKMNTMGIENDKDSLDTLLKYTNHGNDKTPWWEKKKTPTKGRPSMTPSKSKNGESSHVPKQVDDVGKEVRSGSQEEKKSATGFIASSPGGQLTTPESHVTKLKPSSKVLAKLGTSISVPSAASTPSKIVPAVPKNFPPSPSTVNKASVPSATPMKSNRSKVGSAGPKNFPSSLPKFGNPPTPPAAGSPFASTKLGRPSLSKIVPTVPKRSSPSPPKFNWASTQPAASPLALSKKSSLSNIGTVTPKNSSPFPPEIYETAKIGSSNKSATSKKDVELDSKNPFSGYAGMVTPTSLKFVGKLPDTPSKIPKPFSNRNVGKLHPGVERLEETKRGNEQPKRGINSDASIASTSSTSAVPSVQSPPSPGALKSLVVVPKTAPVMPTQPSVSTSTLNAKKSSESFEFTFSTDQAWPSSARKTRSSDAQQSNSATGLGKEVHYSANSIVEDSSDSFEEIGLDDSDFSVSDATWEALDQLGEESKLLEQSSQQGSRVFKPDLSDPFFGIHRSKLDDLRGPIRSDSMGDLVEEETGDWLDLAAATALPASRSKSARGPPNPYLQERKNGGTGWDDARKPKTFSRLLKNWWTGSSRPPREDEA